MENKKEIQKLKNKLKKEQKEIKKLRSLLIKRNIVMVFKVSINEQKILLKEAIKKNISISEIIRKKLFKL